MTNDKDKSDPKDEVGKGETKKEHDLKLSQEKALKTDKEVERLKAKEFKSTSSYQGASNADLVADKSSILIAENQKNSKENASPEETIDDSDLVASNSEQSSLVDDTNKSLNENISDSVTNQDETSEQIAGNAKTPQLTRIGKGGGVTTPEGATVHFSSEYNVSSQVGNENIASNSSVNALKEPSSQVPPLHQIITTDALVNATEQLTDKPKTGGYTQPLSKEVAQIAAVQSPEQTQQKVPEPKHQEIPLSAVITLNEITLDNTINNAEASALVQITGTVGGDVKDNDLVTLSIGNQVFNGVVVNGIFQIAVSGSSLLNEDKVIAEFTVNNAEGHSLTVSTEQHYLVDTSIFAKDDQSTAVEDQGPLATSGNVLGNDDQDSTHVTTTDFVGRFGIYQFKTDGSYTYELDNTKVQSFRAGEHQEDFAYYEIKDNAGNTTTAKLTTLIEGTNDRGIIVGTSTVSLTEDKDVHSGQLRADGALTVTDVDAGDNQFSAEIIQGQFGTLSINNLGHWTYTADNSQPSIQGLKTGESVTDTVLVHSVDGTSQQVSVTINGTDDNAVIAGNSTAQLTEDKNVHAGQLRVDGALTIADLDNGQAQFSAESMQGQFGSLSINNLGHWTYTADNSQPTIQGLKTGESVTDTVLVHSIDGTSQQVSVTINGTDDKAIIAGTSTASLTEDKDVHAGQLRIDGALTVTDNDNGQAQFSAESMQGQFGTLSINNLGHWTYTADNSQVSIQGLKTGESVTDTVLVHSIDGTSQQVSVTINGTDDKAIIGGTSTATITEDVNANAVNTLKGHPVIHHGIATHGQLTISDLDNGESNFIGQQTDQAHGTFILNENGFWNYTVDNSSSAVQSIGLGQSITDTISVSSADGTTHDIVVTIQGTNDAPKISAEVILQTGTEDTNIILTQTQLLVNSSDIDSNDLNQLHIDSVTSNHGAITKNADGSFTFHPDQDYNGQVHFTYEVKDAHGGITHTGASTTLAAINDNPDVLPITDTVKEDASNHHTVDLLLGASDKEGDTLSVNQLSYSIDGSSNSAQLPPGISLDTDGHTIIVDATNAAYQHLANGQSQTITIAYQVIDGQGGHTQQTADLTIEGTDDKATLVSNVIQLTETQALDSKYHTYKGNLQLIDPDSGDNTQFTFSGRYLGLGYEPGHFDVWPDGSYQFRLQSATNRHADDLISSLHAGESMEIPYEVKTNDGQKITIMVKVIGEDNQARIEVGRYSSFDNHAYEDNISPGSTPNQIYSGGNLKVIDPDHSQAGFIAQHVTTSEGGSFFINPRGNWAYTIDNDKLQHLGSGESYQKTFTVDSIDGSAHQNITVTVHGTNDAPVVSAQVQIAQGTEDTDIHINVVNLLANATDVDDNDAGMLTIGNLVADHGTISDNNNGTYTFHPEQDYNGQVHFTYDVKDAHGGVTTTGVTTTLSAVRDSAVITEVNTGSITEDGAHSSQNAGTVTELATGRLSVVDPDSGENAFQYSQFGETKIHDPYNGFLRIDNSGNWTYRVDNSRLQYLAEGQTEVVTYQVHSSDGTPYKLHINVIGTNDVPTVSHVVLSNGTEDVNYQMQASQFGFNDVDSGETLHSIAITNLPSAAEGKFVLDGHGVSVNQVIDAGDISKLQFVPVKDFNGDVSFKFTVNDGHGDSIEATNVLHIDSTNDASIITGDSSSTISEGNIGDTVTTTGQLTITDVDTGQTPTFPDVSSIATTYGHIEMHNGQWTYILDENKVQQLDPDQPAVIDHHTFTATDGSSQMVDISIKGTNDKAIIESAHAAPAGASASLKLQNVEIIDNPTGANIDVAHTDAENTSRWGADITGVGSGLKLIGLYKPGSDKNWIQLGHEATTSTAHSGPGGYNRIDNHDWWASNGVPDTVNTGSGGASGHGNAWTGGIAIFEDNAGHQTIGIINRVCTGGGSEVDYLYYHQYTNLHVGGATFSGTGTVGETINVMEGNTHVASATVDANGYWEVAANKLSDGDHNIHIENSQGVQSADHLYQVHGASIEDKTPAGLNAEIKEDTAQTIINGELRTSDIDSGDTAQFVSQADHATQYGHFSLDANGQYHYTIDNTNPNVDHLGVHQTLTEVIPVTSTSTDGTSVTTNVTITIQGSVDKPILSTNVPDAQQGTAIALDLNVASVDTGGDTEALLIKVSGLPDLATLNHGTYDNIAKIWVLDKSDLVGLTLDLKDPNFHGNLHLNVTATASAAGESESTTQAITLFVNEPPQVAAPVTGSKTEDSGFGAVDLLDGATDADSGDILTVADIQYQVGTGNQSSNKPSFLTFGKDGHTLIINPDASEFQHLATGETETITLSYNVSDSHGGHVAQTAILTITGTNDVAKISGQIITDNRSHVTEDTHISGSHMLSSDLMTLSVTDPESGENYFVPTGASGQTDAHSNGSWVSGDQNVGQFILHASGQWLFRADNNNPKINSLGEGEKITDTITAHSADGTTQQLTAVIYGTNDKPTITVQSILSNEDTNYQFSANDFGYTDVDTSDTLDHITINSLPNAAQGQLLLNGVAVSDNQSITAAEITHLSFTPAPNFNGDVHFSYTVNDGHVDSVPVTTTLTISNVNDLPTVTATTSSATEDTDIIITKAQLLAGSADIDSGDNLDINGITVNGGQGTVTYNGNGTWTLHPEANFKGDISLTYKVNDGHVDVDNHMTVTVSSVTDKATSSLSLTAEQQVMRFSPSSGGGLTNNGHLQTGGDIDNLAVEFNVIGGPTAPPAGHNGPTFISYGTSHSENEFYVWNPTNLTIRVDGTEYKTGISATDGLTHRYSVLWSSTTGHLEMLVDGESKWVHSGPVAQGYKIPGNGILAIGNDQDHYNVETGSHADHGFSTADAFHGEIFSASLANAPVTAAQLKLAPLSSVIDKDNGLVIDIRANSAGQFVDATGHHQLTPTTDVQSQLTLVDTNVAIPNTDALIHLNPTVTPPTDTSDVITKVELTGLLKGTLVDDGHGHQHTITSMTDLVNLKDWNIATLTAQLPGGNTQNMNIGLIVTTQGPDGAIATDSQYQSLVLDPNKPVPDAIITGDKQLSTDEVTAVSGQLVITDTDASQVHFIAEVIPSAHGEFSVKANGSWEFTPNKVAETLTQGHNATDIITVKTIDGSEQKLSVILVGSDTAPTAVTTDLGESEAGSIRIIQVADLLAQVTDVDTLAANLSVVAGSLTSSHGSFSLNTDGSYSFTPTAGFSGQDLAIQYKVTDGTTQVDTNAVIDVYPPLAITRIGHDTGSSATDFITSDGHIIVHGTGHPGNIVHGLGSVLNGLDTTVDANGQWSIDASATDKADNTYSLIVYVAKADGSYPQAKHSVTIDTAKPTISIDPISKDDWVDHSEHNQALSITGDTTHVADGDMVNVTIAGKQYTASVQHNHWQLSIPALEVAHISDNAYLVHAEVSSTATGDSTHSDRHIVVSADLSTLIQTESTEEDTKISATGDLFAINSFNTVTNTGLIQGNFGSIRLNADGSYQYELNNAQQNIQQMSAGDKYSDNFFVSYTNPHGDLKHAVLNVGIHGTNDSPAMTGTFEISRAVTNGYHTNTHSYGYINISDADQGDLLTIEYVDRDGVSHVLDLNDNHSDKIDVEGIGYFNIESNGRWDFTFSKSGPIRDQMEKDVAAGQIHTESITLKVTDSNGESRQETLTVHIGDGNTGPQIFGASESVVTEDSISRSHGLLDLLVGDVKVASGVTWALQPGSAARYGDLTFKPDGSWEYQSHNSDPRVQALSAGERLEETILVTATDSNGHSVDQTMTLVIIGTNDVPTIGHQNTATVVEDNLLTLTKAQLLANVKDIDGLDNLSIENIHMNGKGTITAEGDHWVVHPNLNFDGNLRLVYEVNDGHVSVASSMAINVSPDADTPTLIFTKHVGDLSAPLDSMSIAGNENTDLALNINVASPDVSESLTVEISGVPAGATLSAGIEHNGVWTIDQADLTNLKLTPAQDFSGDFTIQVHATSHDGADTNSVSQQIGVHVIAELSPVSPASDPISASPLSDMSDSPQADMAPVDYYLNMVGLSNDDVASQDSPSRSGDHLAAYVGGDSSMGADPLVDDMQSNAFENLLDDEHKSHDIQHEQTLLDSDSDSSHLENLAPDDDDDDSLHQALNDMHSQF